MLFIFLPFLLGIFCYGPPTFSLKHCRAVRRKQIANKKVTTYIKYIIALALYQQTQIIMGATKKKKHSNPLFLGQRKCGTRRTLCGSLQTFGLIHEQVCHPNWHTTGTQCGGWCDISTNICPSSRHPWICAALAWPSQLVQPSLGLAEHELTAPKKSPPKNVALQAVKAGVQVQVSVWKKMCNRMWTSSSRYWAAAAFAEQQPTEKRTQCQLTLRSLLTGNYMW